MIYHTLSSSKIRNDMSQNWLSVAVEIGALRVNQNKIYCLHAGHFCSFLSSADWFQNYIFKINLFVIPSECQTKFFDPDQSRLFSWPYMRPNCLGSFSADDYK